MKREKFVTLIIFLSIFILTLLDIGYDLITGNSIEHVIIEVGLIVLATAGGTHLIRSVWTELQASLRLSKHEAAEYKKQAETWRTEASNLIQGLSEQIHRQFVVWGLSRAEEEVALLLIKGLAPKEIATIREVKEKTIRQQTLSIYQKAGINSRAELSAFFLEDLLQPQPALATSETVSLINQVQEDQSPAV